MHRRAFESGDPANEWIGPTLLPISLSTTEWIYGSKRTNEIIRKIDNHHLPDISATFREEREARPGKKPLSGIDTSKREEERPPRMNKRHLPDKKKKKKRKKWRKEKKGKFANRNAIYQRKNYTRNLKPTEKKKLINRNWRHLPKRIRTK